MALRTLKVPAERARYGKPRRDNIEFHGNRSVGRLHAHLIVDRVQQKAFTTFLHPILVGHNRITVIVVARPQLSIENAPTQFVGPKTFKITVRFQLRISAKNLILVDTLLHTTEVGGRGSVCRSRQIQPQGVARVYLPPHFQRGNQVERMRVVRTFQTVNPLLSRHTQCIVKMVTERLPPLGIIKAFHFTAAFQRRTFQILVLAPCLLIAHTAGQSADSPTFFVVAVHNQGIVTAVNGCQIVDEVGTGRNFSRAIGALRMLICPGGNDIQHHRLARIKFILAVEVKRR